MVTDTSQSGILSLDCSEQVPASVHHHGLPGDIARGAAKEEADYWGYVIQRVTHPSEGHQVGQLSCERRLSFVCARECGCLRKGGDSHHVHAVLCFALMTRFGLRFDLRNPSFSGVTMAERVTAAIEMAEWADNNGLEVLILSEHHGSEDGYLPSASAMAAAFAACTTRIHVQIAAVVAAFHEPLVLAEELAVIDHISRGRLSVVVANGYVEREFAMFGVSRRERTARTERLVGVLREAWTGEPFEYEGREVRVTPAPCRPGGPRIGLGGSSVAAAKRAARIADFFVPSDPALWPSYREERVALGHGDPGPYTAGIQAFVHLARDPEAAWDAIAPYALHEAQSYATWEAPSGKQAAAVEAGELRRSGRYRVLTPDAFVDELRQGDPDALYLLHPMMGGIPPEMAWESLRILEGEVLPALRQATSSARGRAGC